MDEVKIRFLEHLTYIIEALAQGIVSEAKYELGKLIHRTETGDLSKLENKVTFIPRLNEAETLLQATARQSDSAASCLTGISRTLWKEILDRI